MEATRSFITLTALSTLTLACATGSSSNGVPGRDADPPQTERFSASPVATTADGPVDGSGGTGGSDQVTTAGGSDGGGGSGGDVSSSSSTGGGNQPPTCGPTLTLCGDACTATATDPLNCGACGHSCKTGQACSSGQCTVTATLYISGDDGASAFIDGKLVATNSNWFVATKATITLTAGDHTLAIAASNLANGTNPGAVIADLSAGPLRIVTDTSWDSSTSPQPNWNLLGGGLPNPVPPVSHDGILNTIWWARDPVTFAAKNFPDDSSALWVWSDGFLTDGSVYLRKNFTID